MRTPLLAAAALFVLAAPAAAQDRAMTDQQAPLRTIAVTGQGTASAAPDLATLRFSVRSRGGTAGEAMRANAATMTKVRDRLRRAGIDARDMQTSGLGLNPYYEDRRSSGPNAREIAGYEAYNALMVRLREVDEAGRTIDAAIEAGANGLDSLQFGFEDDGALRDEARIAAVKNARAKASLLAKEAGVRLGQVLSITEGGAARPRPEMMMRSVQSDMASTPIEAGENEVGAQVSVVFELE